MCGLNLILVCCDLLNAVNVWFDDISQGAACCTEKHSFKKTKKQNTYKTKQRQRKHIKKYIKNVLSSENLWNQKKANNMNNNVVRVYGDVIHTGQRLGLEMVWLPVDLIHFIFVMPSDRLVRTTSKLFQQSQRA